MAFSNKSFVAGVEVLVDHYRVFVLCKKTAPSCNIPKEGRRVMSKRHKTEGSAVRAAKKFIKDTK